MMRRRSWGGVGMKGGNGWITKVTFVVVDRDGLVR